jgi:hypothetical protein
MPGRRLLLQSDLQLLQLRLSPKRLKPYWVIEIYDREGLATPAHPSPAVFGSSHWLFVDNLHHS